MRCTGLRVDDSNVLKLMYADAHRISISPQAYSGEKFIKKKKKKNLNNA